jgi:TRAP-type C4-dicarboxylate transport system permease small subunit
MGLLIYHGTLRVWENRNALIQSVPISISYFYLAIPIGSGLILLDYLLILFNKGEHPYARNNL